jgi:tetratricopeptide (TPR) repeat protein
VIFPFKRAATAVLALSLAAAPLMTRADESAGAYLAGRQALLESNYEQAARYYTRALAADPRNPTLLENLTVAQLALGNVRRALPVAQQMQDMDLKSQIGNMVLVAGSILEGEFGLLTGPEDEQPVVGILVDGLLRGWALMEEGSVSRALDQFDAVAAEKGLRNFALFHKALALATVGDFEGAEALFASDNDQLTLVSRRAAIARAQILSRLGRNELALEMLSDVFGGSTDPGLTLVTQQLEAGEELSLEVAATPREGMAEVFYSIGAALNGEAADDFALIYARVAVALRPDHIDGILLSAELLDKLGQYSLADATYRAVPRDDPDYHAAELGRAEALRRAARPDAAIEVLEQLVRDYPEHGAAYSSLGDLQRQEENYERAIRAYDNALKFTDQDAGGRWFLLYARGISYERLKDWPKAEADFRAALELSPDQPQVLNYLGYSLVEKQIKLDEALEMIERAVAARPDSGYIVDSLGWVLYRLGRYEDAVGHMERAVALMPVDPVVNDHLGDVYWAVGRNREAEFQWSRALSFIDPEDTDGEADPDRIRRKLEVGLDQVLADEGAPPLKVANDDG